MQKKKKNRKFLSRYLLPFLSCAVNLSKSVTLWYRQLSAQSCPFILSSAVLRLCCKASCWADGAWWWFWVLAALTKFNKIFRCGTTLSLKWLWSWSSLIFSDDPHPSSRNGHCFLGQSPLGSWCFFNSCSWMFSFPQLGQAMYMWSQDPMWFS